MPEQSPWPPPNYFTTFGPFNNPYFQTHRIHPIDVSWPITVEGKRVARYQLPLAPVEIGKVLISGYLRSTDDGKLLDRHNEEVGTIDHDSGIIVIDVEASPELGDRIVSFFYPRTVAPAC
jgi:hypothetical protein